MKKTTFRIISLVAVCSILSGYTAQSNFPASESQTDETDTESSEGLSNVENLIVTELKNNLLFCSNCRFGQVTAEAGDEITYKIYKGNQTNYFRVECGQADDMEFYYYDATGQLVRENDRREDTTLWCEGSFQMEDDYVGQEGKDSNAVYQAFDDYFQSEIALIPENSDYEIEWAALCDLYFTSDGKAYMMSYWKDSDGNVLLDPLEYDASNEEKNTSLQVIEPYRFGYVFFQTDENASYETYESFANANYGFSLSGFIGAYGTSTGNVEVLANSAPDYFELEMDCSTESFLQKLEKNADYYKYREGKNKID